MRRHDRQIAERDRIDDIIRRSPVCRLAMCDGGQPYVLPLSFGYDGGHLYFHAAPEGRKLAVLRRNPRVCFEFDILHEVVTGPEACNWSMRYESVVGFGTAEFLENPAARAEALNHIMRQYSGRDWVFPPPSLARTLVFRVRIEEIAGKCRR